MNERVFGQVGETQGSWFLLFRQGHRWPARISDSGRLLDVALVQTPLEKIWALPDGEHECTCRINAVQVVTFFIERRRP